MIFYAIGLLMLLQSQTIQTAQELSILENSGYIQTSQASIFYKKFYTVVNEHDTPLLVLHGGPGCSHHYLLSLQELARTCPVILYEQGGCGSSTMYDQNFTAWTLDYYVKELGEVIANCGYQKIYLAGHSWGGMLATAYAEHHQEQILKLILMSPCLSAQQWMADCKTLAQSVSHELCSTIIDHEAAGTTDATQYGAAVEQFYANFFCRKPFESSGLLQRKIYESMWGKYEMTATGNLRDVDVSSILPTLHMPVLFMTGQYDMAMPVTIQQYASMVSDSHCVIISDAAHMIIYEQADMVIAIMKEFLGV